MDFTDDPEPAFTGGGGTRLSGEHILPMTLEQVVEAAGLGTLLDSDYPYFWSSTTHLDGPHNWGVYVAFGKAWGHMEQPPGSGNYNLLNVHGAGAQRSDPKDGDPANWPNGNGPQGDVVRIFNYVRCVRDAVPKSCAQY